MIPSKIRVNPGSTGKNPIRHYPKRFLKLSQKKSKNQSTVMMKLVNLCLKITNIFRHLVQPVVPK